MNKLSLKKESLTLLSLDELRAAVGGAITTNCTAYCTLDFNVCMPSNTHACTNSC